MYEQYEHHGVRVWVRDDLKGKHRSFCLCFSCNKFKPGKPDNCPIANDTYQNCVRHNLTTPVFECPVFELDKKNPCAGEVVTLEEIKGDSALKLRLMKTQVMIRSREHNAFWRVGGCGYTKHAWDAGVYSFQDAFDATCHCGKEKGIEFVVV